MSMIGSYRAHFCSYYSFIVFAVLQIILINSSYQLLALTIRDCSLIDCGQQGYQAQTNLHHDQREAELPSARTVNPLQLSRIGQASYHNRLWLNAEHPQKRKADFNSSIPLTIQRSVHLLANISLCCCMNLTYGVEFSKILYYYKLVTLRLYSYTT